MGCIARKQRTAKTRRGKEAETLGNSLRLCAFVVTFLARDFPLGIEFIGRIRMLPLCVLCVIAVSLPPFPLDMGSIARNRSATGRARCKPGTSMLDTARAAARGSGAPKISYCFVAL